MSRPASSSKRSFVEPAIAERSRSSTDARRTAARAVVRFLVQLLLLSTALSLVALPFVDLPWWKVVRRCASIGAALSLWWSVRRRERRTFASYGLTFQGAGKGEARFGLLAGFGSLFVMVGAGLVTGACRIDIDPDTVKVWSTLAGFLPAAGLVGILEELVFRGFLLRHLMAYSRLTAVAVTSALYAVVHLREAAMTASTARELTGLFLLGAVLALSALRTGRLSMAIGLHAALAYGARVNKLVLAIDSSSAWLTGTSRLVNGVVSWAVLLGLGGLVWWKTRNRRAGGAALQATTASGH
jgi:membrane protease YdiL (CAAX protease family)